MSDNVKKLRPDGNPEGLVFDPADYGIGLAHDAAVLEVMRREAKAIRSAARHGTVRSRERLERLSEVHELVRAVCEVEAQR